MSVLMLIIAIAVAFSAGYIYREWRNRNTELQPYPEAPGLDAFMASVREKENKWKGNDYYTQEQRQPQPELVPFNPNTADSATLRKLGLPGWMARNILRYREKGGKFRKAEDFRKIYGLTDEQYRQLLPYIAIPPEDTVRKEVQLYRPPVQDSIPKPYKYPEGTIIALNSADTAELKKIPGIGSGIARLITGYRQRLGGFYRIEQLQEIHLDYRQLIPWFSIDSTAIRRINLNRASVARLRNHPYINFYQAKALVEYRKKHGKLKNLKPFVLYEEFTAEDLERIGHYVCFED